MSRERAQRVATVIDSDDLRNLAASDVYWDAIAEVAEAGIEDVFDIEVEGLHNFVANDIVVHNSIEQDADVVMFIYRDEYYTKEDSEEQGLADLLISKHRNGGLGDVKLVFRSEFPKFRQATREH